MRNSGGRVLNRPAKQRLDSATRELARLNEQAGAVRAELARLVGSLAEVRREFEIRNGSDLREANEQLIIAALQSDQIAESAMSNLSDLAHSSQRDPLTNTPNRSLMVDRINTAGALARRHGKHLALFFLDIDSFKGINDTMGHQTGDEVLQLVARRLESVVRDSDTVSRHSGDEFVVLLSDLENESDSAVIAAKILASLAEPSIIGGRVVSLSASIGISIFPQDGEDAATLINHADAAMYRSKRNGRGGFTFHREADAAADHEHLAGSEMLPMKLRLKGAARASRPEKPRRRHSEEVAQAARLHDLREANEHLVLSALTAQQLQEEVAQANRRQINFLALVAHELRDPLTPILTAAQLLDHARSDKKLLARVKKVIERQVDHMARLVEDLLDGSRAGGRPRRECGGAERWNGARKRVCRDLAPVCRGGGERDGEVMADGVWCVWVTCATGGLRLAADLRRALAPTPAGEPCEGAVYQRFLTVDP
jgi:diguanylate cyclase (GGDEF)-like protein